jgi:RHS repeat-associated protein
VVTNGGLPNNSALNGTTDYLYNSQRIIEDRNASNTAIKQYVWGQYIDELIQQKLPAVSGAPVFYLLSDLLYRSIAMTNSSGAIVEAYDTDAYGNTICYSGPGTDGLWFTNDDVTTTAPQNCYIFTGRQYDPETRIYDYRERYYHPEFGRFLARDPLGYFTNAESVFPSLNLFNYVNSNPTSLLDQLGMATCCAMESAQQLGCAAILAACTLCGGSETGIGEAICVVAFAGCVSAANASCISCCTRGLAGCPGGAGACC